MTLPDFNRLSNLLGPLDGSLRSRLMRVIEAPTVETWDEAYSIILYPDVGLGLTLWQAVLAVDPSFRSVDPPVSVWIEDNSELGGHSERVSGWSAAPSCETILQAVDYAIQEGTLT